MIFVCVCLCLCVCEFSYGKGGKKNRWVPKKGGIWGRERLGNRHSGSHLESRGLDWVNGMH